MTLDGQACRISWCTYKTYHLNFFFARDMVTFQQGSHSKEKPGKVGDLSESFFPVLKSGIFVKSLELP
jgi:hypothetical protein